jgi:uncharacterized membrane protein
MAALAFAGFDVVIKRSLQAEIEPTTGTMIAIGTGFTAWAIGVAVVPRVRRSVRVGPNLGWLVAGGMMFGVATLCLVHALSRGEVSVVSPILASQPLMVFILSKLFLGEVESVDLSTVVLGSLVVIGTVLVVL